MSSSAIPSANTSGAFAPEIRQGCPAQNCGRRKFLNDLQSVCLDSSVLTEPPLDLWPDVIARVDPPQDVHEKLIDKLP